VGRGALAPAYHPATWSRAAIAAAIAEGATRTLVLPRPVPVFVLYWTGAADPDGVVRFHPDVYGRDGAVLRALDAHP
jgi:murein L,D-transpeptidase YcbB/YkuD